MDLELDKVEEQYAKKLADVIRELEQGGVRIVHDSEWDQHVAAAQAFSVAHLTAIGRLDELESLLAWEHKLPPKLRGYAWTALASLCRPPNPRACALAHRWFETLREAAELGTPMPVAVREMLSALSESQVKARNSERAFKRQEESKTRKRRRAIETALASWRGLAPPRDYDWTRQAEKYLRRSHPHISPPPSRETIRKIVRHLDKKSGQ